MPYEKQNIPAFEGLNMGIEPDAIKDTQAADMLNLRFTKLGYLVNRNGVRAFEFDHHTSPVLPDIAKISGATAIGEFILSAPVTDKVDFEPRGNAVVASVINASHSYPLASYDRFMVYGLRCSYLSEPQKARLVYVLVPNAYLPESTQQWQIDNDANGAQTQGDCVFFLRAEYAGDTEAANAAVPDLLMAPARRMLRGDWVNSGTGTVHDQTWVEHYQRMAQYGNALVIADRQNGDLIIHDKWDETETGQTKEHYLRMQENANAFFDVDVVKVDFRLASGEENGSGVDHGMALYRLFLQRKTAIASDDKYTPTSYDAKVGQEMVSGESDWSWSEKMSSFNSAAFSAVNLSDNNGSVEYDAAGQSYRAYNGGMFKMMVKDTASKPRIFSDYNEPSEIDSLLDTVVQKNPALPTQYDDDDNVINNDAADVFIWNDVKVKYYPVTGSNGVDQFLTGADKKWSKKNPTVPRIVELTTKAGLRQNVALGVWSYRAVWVMGNQEYSSPSAPWMVPDKLWSCSKDAVGLNRYTTLSGSSFEQTHDKVYSTYVGLNAATASGVGQSLLFTGNIVAASGTEYDIVLGKVKSALYEDSHPFGNTAASINRQVLATVTSNGPELKLNGAMLSGYQFDFVLSAQGKYSIYLAHHHKASLVVPMVKTVGKYATYNSIFTDETLQASGTLAGAVGGFYRKSLVDYTYSHQDVIHEFAFEYANNTFAPGYVVNAGPNKGDTGAYQSNRFDLDIVKKRLDIYYNLVVHDANLCNTESEKPIPTLLRYVSKQQNRLSYTKTVASVEAVSRLIAEGIAEFVLMDYTDSATMRSQWIGSYNYAPYSPGGKEPYPPDTDDTVDHLKATSRDYFYSNPSIYPGNANNPPGSSTQYGLMPVPDINFTTTSGVLSSAVGERRWTINHDEVSNTLVPNDHYIKTDTIQIFELFQTFGYNPPSYVDRSWVDRSWFEAYNMRVAIHLIGERLLIPEQATAFFPSSLLFNAPRIQINVAKEDIPKRAKGIMIFRTLATHDNDWQPTKFGLVKSIDLQKDAQGKNVDFSFFDDVKDTELDFTTTPDEFDGITTPLKSLFVKPLKEKVWYGNVVERYKPYAPRGYVDNIENASGTGHVQDLSPNDLVPYSKLASWRELVVDDTQANRDLGFTATLRGKLHEYFIVFKDLNGEYSDPKLISDNNNPQSVDFTSVPSNKLCAVVLVLSGYPYNAAIDKCEVYRRSYNFVNSVKTSSTFYKIGEIKAEDEGIFVDAGESIDPPQPWNQYDDTANEYPVSATREDKLESSIAWSESNQPSWIKYENRFAFRDGDGDQITGMEVIYSELIVFKERSMHRVTLENISNNIGRVEEVSNTIGCIAPNTIICYDNTIYFLSWHGFMKYDNNGISKVDGPFAIELNARLLEEMNSVRNPAIRDASVALNSAHRELYLNIPAYAGLPAYDYRDEGVKGHIYVLNLDNQLATKFQYETGDKQIFTPLRDPAYPSTSGTDYRTMARLYHTNSLGQLWSAETLPKTPYVSSKVYLEAPTTRDYDEFQPGITSSGLPETVSKIVSEPVRSWWKSKEWTGGDKSLLKRLRMVIANIAKGTNPRIGTEFNNDDYSAEAYREAMFGVTGELKVVPSRRVEGSDRGERMTIHIASEGETEIQGLGFHWRKVNTWNR